MGRSEELILTGNGLLDNLTEDNINDINKWMSESLLYVETKYPRTEFAKFFIQDVESFRKQWIGFDIIDKDTLGRLNDQLKGIASHENALKKGQEENLNNVKSALSNMK